MTNKDISNFKQKLLKNKINGHKSVSEMLQEFVQDLLSEDLGCSVETKMDSNGVLQAIFIQTTAEYICQISRPCSH